MTRFLAGVKFACSAVLEIDDLEVMIYRGLKKSELLKFETLEGNCVSRSYQRGNIESKVGAMESEMSEMRTLIHNMAEQKNFITFNSQIIQKMAPKLAWKGCMSVQKNYHVPKRVCVSVKDLFPVINSIDIWHDINAITDNFEQCSCFRKFQSCWGQQRDGKLATKRR